jgi:RimJ/RimL family protein N-acetyltransferase
MGIPILLQRYKYRDIDSPVFQLPILDGNNLVIGSLRCIDTYTLHDIQTINLLTKWRNQNMKYFLTQFLATSVRTRNWLENIVLPADNRIIFLVYDETEKKIGNLGLCNISESYAEIDNVLRGEMSNTKSLFYYAMITVLCWIFEYMNIPNVNLHVFSDNIKAISLYEKLGFKTVKILSLSRVNSENVVSYVLSSDLETHTDYKYQEMLLRKVDFMMTKK